MLPKLDRLLSSPAFDPSLEEATFRIGTTDGAGSTLAPIICREIVPVATRVRFEFCQWHTEMLDELAHGSVDLVFLASVVEVPSSLNSQLVYDEEFVCAVDAQSPIFDAHRRLAPLCTFSRSRTRADAGCTVGQHTDAVLREIGLDEAAIVDLRAKEIVGGG